MVRLTVWYIFFWLCISVFKDLVGIKVDYGLGVCYIFLLLQPASEEDLGWGWYRRIGGWRVWGNEMSLFRVLILGVFRRIKLGERKEKKVFKKAWQIQKDFYLCNPKQIGRYRTEFSNGITRLRGCDLQTDDWTRKTRLKQSRSPYKI